MVVLEPAHLVGVVKTCPRPGCRSPHIKWRYYNNGSKMQPRYQCKDCKKHFTYGRQVRLSKEEKQAALREVEETAAAAKKAEKLAAKKVSKEAAKEQVADLGAVEPLKSNSNQLLHVIASPTTKAKWMPRIRLRLIGGAVIDLSYSFEMEVVATANAPAVRQQGQAGLDSELVASESSEVDCAGPGGSDHLELDSGYVTSSELGAIDNVGSVGSKFELDSKDTMISGLSNMRSWGCLYL